MTRYLFTESYTAFLHPIRLPFTTDNLLQRTNERNHKRARSAQHQSGAAALLRTVALRRGPSRWCGPSHPRSQEHRWPCRTGPPAAVEAGLGTGCQGSNWKGWWKRPRCRKRCKPPQPRQPSPCCGSGAPWCVHARWPAQLGARSPTLVLQPHPAGVVLKGSKGSMSGGGGQRRARWRWRRYQGVKARLQFVRRACFQVVELDKRHATRVRVGGPRTLQPYTCCVQGLRLL